MTVTFQISEDQLQSSLGPVALFAGTDKTLPRLRAVQLTVSGGSDVVLTATDRFTAAIAQPTVAHVKAPHNVQVLVELDDVKKILATFKKMPPASMVLFDVDPDRVTVSALNGATLTLRPLEGDYPRVASLFRNALEGAGVNESIGSQRVGSAHLERVAKASKLIKTIERGTVPTVLEVHGSGLRKPVLYVLGDQVLALVMPHVGADAVEKAAGLITDWTNRLGEVA